MKKRTLLFVSLALLLMISIAFIFGCSKNDKEGETDIGEAIEAVESGNDTNAQSTDSDEDESENDQTKDTESETTEEKREVVTADIDDVNGGWTPGWN